MSTAYDDEPLVREMLNAYDAPQPSAAFRDRLQQQLRQELRQATGRAPAAGSKSFHRSPSRRLAYLTAAGLLSVVGIAVGIAYSAQGFAPRPLAHDLGRTGQVVSIRSQPKAALPVVVEAAVPVKKQRQSANVETALPAPLDKSLAKVAIEDSQDGTDDLAYQPMHFVMHTVGASPTPEQQHWQQAWCFFVESDEPSEIFNRWQACQSEVEIDIDMAYRMQSAAGARERFDPLVRSLLADVNEAAVFVDTLLNIDEETVQQLTAQLSSEMATSATLYLELLHRSRDAHDMEVIDEHLHDALARNDVGDVHRELVEAWLQRLENEKQRRNPGPIMM